jgi:hypothetical protein
VESELLRGPDCGVDQMTVEAVACSIVTRKRLGVGYVPLCRLIGLEPTDTGWGLVHCVTEQGERLTRVTDDVPYLELMTEGNWFEFRGGLELPSYKFPKQRAGWPDEWTGRLGTERQDRNDRCWCGSGKKFKRCHGEPPPHLTAATEFRARL